MRTTNISDSILIFGKVINAERLDIPVKSKTNKKKESEMFSSDKTNFKYYHVNLARGGTMSRKRRG